MKDNTDDFPGSCCCYLKLHKIKITKPLQKIKEHLHFDCLPSIFLNGNIIFQTNVNCLGGLAGGKARV